MQLIMFIIVTKFNGKAQKLSNQHYVASYLFISVIVVITHTVGDHPTESRMFRLPMVLP